jgi:type 1 fimbriae regulatory protein FimB
MEHLNREQLVGLLRQARAHQERNWVLLLVSFWHGLRASEAVSLTPANFSISSSGIYLEIQRLKGSLRTVQPLVQDPDELLNERKAVEAWLDRHGEQYGDEARSRLLFPISRIQFYRLVRRYGREAGLPQHLCHPHVLKHSIAMQTIKAAGIENVRQYLGHRSISSTGVYLQVDDDVASRAIASAMKLAP